DRGPLTFGEVHRRTNALARALRRASLDDRDTVAVMCRNHRWFIEVSVACSKLGVNIVYLDPTAAASRIAEVVEREDPHALIYDEEFSELLSPVGRGRAHFIAWCDPDRPARCPLLEEMIAREGSVAVEPPRMGAASTVLLASKREQGTTGGDRKLPNSLMVPGAVISRIPLRRGEVTVVAAPMYETWGFLHFMLGLRLASTLILTRVPDPTSTLEAAERHGASALAVLPETLKGIIELPEATTACYDTSALRVIAVQGPELPGEVALPAIELFGDVLYNLHGSTVVRLNGDWVKQPLGARESAPALPTYG
ncbi:MAG TPA: AMP-binding protein, partial [Solirubrobacteraceae bacterium]